MGEARGRRRTVYLVLLDPGGQAWSWELGTAPLVIGRSDNCDIRLSDPALSRRHAKVWAENGAVRFEDLGSRNVLLLNGVAATEGLLRVGDFLEAGLSRFCISEAPVAVDRTPANLCPTPITLSARMASYLQEPLAAPSEPPSTRKVNELHALFHLGREMGGVASIRALTELLDRTLREQFRTRACWIAWCYAESTAPHIQPVEDGDAIGEGPLALLKEALDTREGVVKPVVRGTDGGRHMETVMAVPMVHAGQTLGGFVARSPFPGPIYAEDDLQFALGIAAIAAPHVRAVRLAEQLRRDHDALRARTGVGGLLLGESPAIQSVQRQLARAGNSTLPVLIMGETGTGKEIAARLLHEHSTRREGPYVVVNCAAIPHNLFESEFFGHEKGSFTGATQQRIGRLEEAHGGTLFLDEVGDLSLENQARILRAIETGAFHRVGGEKVIRVDVRVVSATNKRLEEPAFRVDLLHRLNGVTIAMPPLRERPEDVPLLAEHFIRLSSSHGPERVTGLNAEAIALLRGHAWPGNVRELRAAVDRAILFARGTLLTPTDFALSSGAGAQCDTGSAARREARDTSAPQTLAEMERVHIQEAIRHSGGNIAQAARLLGVNRATLYRKLAEYAEK